MRFTFGSSRSPPSTMSVLAQAGTSLLLATNLVSAIQLDPTNANSIKAATAEIAKDLWDYYSTTTIPGNFPAPYYWWECGAMMMTMIEYWYYTNDTTYNDGVTEALQFQVGPYANYMTPNQSRSTGNDDQAFWAFAAMDAAEFKYPNPPPDQPQWLALAQAVFNTQVARWDDQTCGGGLRWQITFANPGYNYKNTISNGCFFALAARLQLYTGNTTYGYWAEKAYNWTTNVGLIRNDYYCYDGLDTINNCSLSTVNNLPFSYVPAVFMHGAANMWNSTQDPRWRTVVDGLLANFREVYLPNNGSVIVEVACETIGTCNYDQRSFKAYTARWLAATTQLCPWTSDIITPIIRASSVAAATVGCKDGPCHLAWTLQGYNDWVGETGPGESMAALSVIGSNLVYRSPKTVTAKSGGISQGNPGAGSGGSDQPPLPYANDIITTGDRAGAGIVTAVVLLAFLGGGFWASSNISE